MQSFSRRFYRKSDNVEQFYAFVGILEEYEAFLELAQRVTPAFFAGAPRNRWKLIFSKDCFNELVIIYEII